ncbi:MAG: hypothetical protein AAFZ65_20075 [Planctomycetota bacterium]
MQQQLLSSVTCLAAGALLSATASAQTTYRTIAEESFDLPPATFLGDNGSGIGWAEPWFSGGTGQEAIVLGPGFDAVGNAALTNNPDILTPGDYQNFRRLDLVGFENISDASFGSADGPLLGADDTTIWIRFLTQRFPGGDDAYGGVSLFIFLDPNGVGEYLFLGTPFNVGEYGIDTTLSGQGPGFVTSGFGLIDQLAELVYRIDFRPGNERIQMWIDPVEDYPSSNPVLDVNDIPDFRFNEVRFASGTGGGASGGALSGWFFDGIRIECQDCPPPPQLEAVPANLSTVSGGTSNLVLQAGSPNGNKTFYLAGSLSGTSPGLPLAGDILPLNPDAYFNLTLAGNAPLTNQLGQLDDLGRGVAQFNLPAGFTNLAGLTVHHAYVVLDLTLGGQIVFVSDAGGLALEF